jgi:TolB protein
VKRAFFAWALLAAGFVHAAKPAIAVAQFAGGPFAKEISDIVRADLSRSGQFDVQADSAMLPQPSSDQNVGFGDWQALNVQQVLIGRVSGSAKGVQRLSYALCEVIRQSCQAPVTLNTAKVQLRASAHQVSDAAYETLTGKRGVFSTRIAYISSTGRGRAIRYSLIVADQDGMNPAAIVTSDDPLLSPAWAPDARKVAYVSFERGNSAIYLHELATGNRRLISSFRGINGSPAFSPDGSKLALTLSKTGNPEIYLYDLASGGYTQLTKSYGIDTEAAFLPGGAGLLFTSDRGGKPQIYRMGLDGSNVSQLTFFGKENARSSILGSLLATVQTEKGVSRIAVYQQAGSGGVRFVSGGKLDESPSFAPNGQMLLFAARSGGKGVLSVVSADGRVRTQLSTPPGDVREPAWSPFRQR